MVVGGWWINIERDKEKPEVPVVPIGKVGIGAK
jgi:hypothetical protein